MAARPTLTDPTRWVVAASQGPAFHLGTEFTEDENRCAVIARYYFINGHKGEIECQKVPLGCVLKSINGSNVLGMGLHTIRNLVEAALLKNSSTLEFAPPSAAPVTADELAPYAVEVK
jgi:hypothetical protein